MLLAGWPTDSLDCVVSDRPFVLRRLPYEGKRDPIVLTISRQRSDIEAIYREAMDGICRAA